MILDCTASERNAAPRTESQSHAGIRRATFAIHQWPSGHRARHVDTNGKLISGKWSDKVTSSTCHLADASVMHAPFNVSELSSWRGIGAVTFHGQAFLKTVGGDVKICAGSRVVLFPATPYVNELLTKEALGISVKVDPRLGAYSRTTLCDARGNFFLRWTADAPMVFGH